MTDTNEPKQNSCKRVLPQLFDVKPMKNSADLDWESIERVKEVLDLKDCLTEKEMRVRREALILGYDDVLNKEELANLCPCKKTPSNKFQNVVSEKDPYITKVRKVSIISQSKKYVAPSNKQVKDTDLEGSKPAEIDFGYSQLLFDDYFAATDIQNQNQEGSGNATGKEVRNINYEEPVSKEFNKRIIANESPVKEEESDDLSRLSLSDRTFNTLTSEDALEEISRVEIQDRFMEDEVVEREKKKVQYEKKKPKKFTDGYIVKQQSLKAHEFEKSTFESIQGDGAMSRILSSMYLKVSLAAVLVVVIGFIASSSVLSALGSRRDSIKGRDLTSSAANSSLVFDRDGSELSPVAYFKDNFKSLQGKELLDGFLGFLSGSGQRYLLVFQNTSEVKATGGLPDVYSVLEFENGKSKALVIEDVLGVDRQLSVNVVPPRPIQRISTAWSMHDANWFSDFSLSAKKMAWFYKESGRAAVDGVISFTPDSVLQLLEITGPVSVPGYDALVSADNFKDAIAGNSASNFDSAISGSQKLLKSFIPVFLEKMNSLSSKEWNEALGTLKKSLEEKQTLMFFVNDDAQKLVLKEQWGGKIKSTDNDFLSVVSSRVSGSGSSNLVNEEIQHNVEIQKDGSIIDNVLITKINKNGQNMAGEENLEYVRVYTPLGAEFLSASGFSLKEHRSDIDYDKHGFQQDSAVFSSEVDLRTYSGGVDEFQESGKTVFGGWVGVSAGNRKTVSLKYKLPFKLNAAGGKYSLTAQKQSGSIGSKFEGRIELADNFMPGNMSINMTETSSKEFVVKDSLVKDLFYNLSIR